MIDEKGQAYRTSNRTSKKNIKRDTGADWNVPPCFGKIAHLVGRSSGAQKRYKILSEQEIADIKSSYKAGKMQKNLAIEYGVSVGVINAVINNKMKVKTGDILL